MQLSFLDILFPNRGERKSTTSSTEESRAAAPIPHREILVRKRRPLRVETDAYLQALWRQIRIRWFPQREDLDHYRLRWSKRPQKRTLASCNIELHRVSVARELQPEEFRVWLEPLLYHEMCHAYLGLSVYSETERSRWHGPEFRRLERRHPRMKEFDAWVSNGGWARAVRSDRARRARARVYEVVRIR